MPIHFVRIVAAALGFCLVMFVHRLGLTNPGIDAVSSWGPLRIGAVDAWLSEPGRLRLHENLIELATAAMLLVGALAAHRTSANRVWAFIGTLVPILLVSGIVLRGVFESYGDFPLVLLGLLATGPLKMLDDVIVKQRDQAADLRQHAYMKLVFDRVIGDDLDGVVIIDETGTIIAVSETAWPLLGVLALRSINDLPAELAELLASGSNGRREVTLTVDWRETCLDCVLTCSQVVDETKRSATIRCLTLRDITEYRRGQQRLAYLARHDVQTGALSQPSFVELIEQELANREVCVAVVGVDRLQEITETLGHEAADRVRRMIVKRLAGSLGEVPGRLGGGRFALRLPVESKDELAKMCGGIAEALEAPYDLGQHGAVIEIRMGVAVATAGSDPATVLQEAEIALADAVKGRCRLRIFEEPMRAAIESRRATDAALRAALQRGEFFLLFQPQVSLETLREIGVEALVRWQNPQLGLVSPADFIPLAEETGLIVELGAWVMREAFRLVVDTGYDGRLSVNVSAAQFRLDSVVDLVRDASHKTGFDLRMLDIEITESLFVDNDENVTSACRGLQDLGCKIAIDDFGTGYSSLSYLSRLPVDKIKLDQSFVRTMAADAGSLAIVETVIALATRLDKTVVAEGIETQEQLRVLRELGCGVGQGYLFNKPAPLTHRVEKTCSATKGLPERLAS